MKAQHYGCLALVAAGLAVPAFADTATTQGGIAVKSDNGAFSAALGGRMQLDLATFANDDAGAEYVSGAEFRRLRLHLRGKLYDFSYKFEVDFAEDAAVGRDLYVAREIGPGELTVGQFKQYFTLEDQISSLNTTFLERGYIVQMLAPSYQIGAAYGGAGERYFYSASVYNLDTNDSGHAEGMGLRGRFGFAPIADKGRVIHLGTSLLSEHYGQCRGGGACTDERQTVTVAVRRVAGQLTDDVRERLFQLANGENTEARKYALEFAGVYGPASLQAEYAAGDFDDGVEEGEVRGWYASVSYFLTGESRPYDLGEGRFTGIKPRRSSGAWEVALRYDTARGEESAAGGAASSDKEVTGITAALNWYLNPNLRLMLNAMRTEIEDRITGATLDQTDALLARVSINY
jgi:phosphate-selective porin OprO/OprP